MYTVDHNQYCWNCDACGRRIKFTVNRDRFQCRLMQECYLEFTVDWHTHYPANQIKIITNQLAGFITESKIITNTS